MITDTVDIKTEAFGELFKKYGKVVSEKVMEHHRNNGGVSRYEKFRHYYKYLLKKTIDKDIIRRLDKKYFRLVFTKVIGASYIKVVEEFIKELNRKGKGCFVISATPQKEIRRIVKERGLKRFFKDTVGSPKNKTVNLKGLLKKYRVNPNEAVYFGYAKSDYEAAHNNHTDFIAIVNNRISELAKIRNILMIKNFR